MQLVTPEEAARRLEVPVEAVEIAIQQGILPSYKIAGRHTRIAEEALATVRRGRQRRPVVERIPEPYDLSALGNVYFVGDEYDSPIKVGWTRGAVANRIRELQCGCWVTLVCHGVVRGVDDDEKLIHRELDDYRLRGEWFEREPALALLYRRGTPAASASAVG